MMKEIHMAKKVTEKEFDGLRAECDVQREVIIHLRTEMQRLLEDRKRLLEALVTQGVALDTYRRDALGLTEQAISSAQRGHCTPFCGRHRWDTATGWQRKVDA